MEYEENRSNDTKQNYDYFEPNNERNAESMEQDQGKVYEFKRIQRVKNKIDVYQSA